MRVGSIRLLPAGLACAVFCAGGGGASGAGVVINEVHYNPASETEFVEFVELLNAGTTRADLGGWSFSSGITYTFPAGAYLDPGAFAVVAEDTAAFTGKFRLACLGPYAGRLSSEGEKLTLRSAAGAKMDEVTYKVGFPWPICGDAPGCSMQLLNPELDNDLGGSWRSGAPTPGAANSVYRLLAQVPPLLRQVQAEPAQPTNQQPVRVTVKITDADAVGAVELSYQAVPPGGYIPAYLPLDHATLLATPTLARTANPAFNAAASWTRVTMRDDGQGGDAAAGDSIYSVFVPGSPNRTLVRYRITAGDAGGNSVTVPYADDAAQNFAYFVYNGVPPYQPLKATVHPAGLGHVYGTNVLRSLPVYALLTRAQDLSECIAYNSGLQIPKGNYGRSIENWEGAIVYDGVVYDHINYRLLGANGRYIGSGKRSMHINFNRGHYFAARDNSGKAYPREWKVMLTSKLFGNRGVGGYGMIEAVDGALFRMTGVPAPYTHWFHFRVIDGADEVPAGIDGQYNGDFWGLSLAMENYDGMFLENHELPDGNLYKLTDEGFDGKSEQRSQGRYAVTNAQDYYWIRNNFNSGQSDSWLTTYVNFPAWYRFHTVAEAIRHYDYWVGCNKNMAWFFEPRAGNLYGRMMFLPFDYDDTWGPYWNAGLDEAKAAITQGSGKPALKQEYRNYIREFRDLVWQPEVITALLEDCAAVIRDFVPADRDRWKDAPAAAGYGDFGTLEDKVADMKKFAWVGGSWAGDGGTVTGRAAVLDLLAGEEGDAANLPNTPTLAAVGPPHFPLNALLFQASPFSDPQGNTTFAALKWRVGEVTDTNAPAYDPGQSRLYEVPAVWESGDISNFTAQVTVPPEALRVGHAYRVRVCMKDTTGRWSHWSAPVKFIASDPDTSLLLLNSLRISEIMAHPPADAAEFIELHNRNASEPLELAGVRFSDGIEFSFPSGTVIPPQGYLVVTDASPAGDFAAFRAQYGLGAAVPVAGPWSGSLNDEGEKVTLKTAAGGAVIASFTYGEGRGWPLAAAGAGHSLVPLREMDQADGALEWGGNWRASAYLRGSPGRADPAPVRDILLNEFLAHTDYTNPALPEYDSNDWIELYNAGSNAVAIGGWYLSDDADNLRKWSIPAPRLLDAGGWAVFDEVSGFHAPVTNGFGLSKYGEGIYLSCLGGATNDRVVDCVSFKGQENGASEGRYPDGADGGYALAPTPGAANFRMGRDVVISEVLYHPSPTALNPEDNVPDEFVEIHNCTEHGVALSAGGGAWRLDGDVGFTFPIGTTLAPGEFALIVAFDPANATAAGTFRRTYGLTNGSARLFGPYSGSLANGGGRVAVERPVAPDLPGDPTGWFVVDEVIYGAAEPWAAQPGAGLNRVDPALSGCLPANWMAGPVASPGQAAPRVVLAAPFLNTSFMTPFVTRLRAVVDATQVTGTIERVEFLEGTNWLGAAASPPYECLATGTEARAFAYSVRLVGSEGVSVSPPVTVYGMAVDNGSGASGIYETAATLNGRLTGGGQARVTVYWGEADGGTNAAGWSRNRYVGDCGTGDYSAVADGLVLGRQYFYRSYAETASGGRWASASAVFRVSFDAWRYRMKIAFSGYNRSGAVSNFPALVVLGTDRPGFQYGQFASASAGDLRFLDGSRTTALNYEIESWNPGGASLIWVQVPRLAGPSDAIWACWGNAAATNPPACTGNGAAWSEGYRAVWHFSGGLAEATVNHTAAVDHGTVAGEGRVGGGRRFGGSAAMDPALDADWYYDHVQGLAVSLWVRPTGGVEGATPFGAGQDTARATRFAIQRMSGAWNFMAGSYSGRNFEHSVDVGQWQHLALSMDRGQARAFKNGVPSVGAFTYSTFSPLAAPWLGNLNGTVTLPVYFVGDLDEVRISSAARSAHWVWAEYMTAASNAAFTAYSPVFEAATEDVNGDGIPDAWQRYYFADGESGSAAGEDWDGDGAPNRDEYVAGTHPKDPGSRLQIEALSPLLSAPMIGFMSSTGRIYSLESRAALGGGAWGEVAGQTGITGDGGMVWMTATNAPSATFLRVRARLP